MIETARSANAQVVVDGTHLGRRQSGIERITEMLFSGEALAPLNVEGRVAGAGRAQMLVRQMLALPASALLDRGAVWVFPGYPPSPVFLALRDRTVLYVHDMFLLTRRADLNRASRLYLSPLFRAAVQGLRYFFANSQTTAEQLAPYVRQDAEIQLYRPKISNVFGLSEVAEAPTADGVLRVAALGTVEPRKNLLAGARICAAVAATTGRSVEFHVVGRKGWGDDFDQLARMPHVRLHGFLPDERVRSVIRGFDLFISTSHDEGLGLPLLEVQFAGLPVVAPNRPVFREVLGASGCYIDASDASGAAAVIAAMPRGGGARRVDAANARANIQRWNSLAESDRTDAIDFLSRLGTGAAPRQAEGPSAAAEARPIP